MRWEAVDYFFWGFTTLCVVFLIWLMAVALPTSIREEREFIAACVAKGGVPSKYETMVGKTHESERLCLKKDNIVELRDD